MTFEISADATMEALLVALPGAQRALFRNYHIGGCSSCGFRPDETLAEVCARNGGLNPDEVLETVQRDCEEERGMWIEPAALKAALDEGRDMRMVDIRSGEEFDVVHIDGAFPFNQTLMQTMMAEWPKDTFILIVDHQGTRSLDAASYLAGHGFTAVKCLRGGIDAWSLEVDPELPRYTLE